MNHYIPRLLEDSVVSRLGQDNRIILLFGARQVGKTTLVTHIMQKLPEKSWLWLNGEDPRTADVLSSCDVSRLRGLVAGYSYVVIDESQHIPNVGTALKLIYEQILPAEQQTRLLVTGSSRLSLAEGTREAPTGRTWSYTLYPIAFAELLQVETPFETEGRLEEALVLGMYPSLFSISNREDRIRHLRELVDAYLYRDVLELGGIKNHRKLRDLLRLLAYQVGSEVSYQELGRQAGMSADTVLTYIDLLEKSYVLFRLGAYSRNLRKEISKKDKVYFYDNGVRNILIDDTKEWSLRGDGGALWENFLVSERLKADACHERFCNRYFWRVYTGAELDYLEEKDGRLSAYEFKLTKKPSRPPRSFRETYPDSSFETISKENWLEFIR